MQRMCNCFRASKMCGVVDHSIYIRSLKGIGIGLVGLVLIVIGCAGGGGDGGGTRYVCTNGTAVSGEASADGIERCSACNAGYLLLNARCRTFAALTPTKISDTLATLSLANHDEFGRSVALAGNVLAVGDYGESSASGRGAVYIFTDTDNDGWVDATPDKISNALSTLSLDSGDAFGRSVALAGNVLAVGANGDDDDGSNRGAVYIFTDTDNDGWTDATPDKISDTLTTFSLDNDDFFGRSVALAGNVLAVGANGDDDGGANRGAVYIFTDIDNDGWADATPDKISSALSTLSLGDRDSFGISVALAGNVLAVGANGDDDDGSNRGAVYIFVDSDNDKNWSEETPTKISDTLTTFSLNNIDVFGASVALAGNVLAVGANGDDDGGTNSGAVYLFVDSDNDKNWSEETPTKISNALSTLSLDSGDTFGRSVALAGNVLAVGADEDDDGGTNRGAVYIFRP